MFTTMEKLPGMYMLMKRYSHLMEVVMASYAVYTTVGSQALHL